MDDLNINLNEGSVNGSARMNGIDLGHGIVIPFPGEIWEPIAWREEMWNSGGFFTGLRIGSMNDIHKGSSMDQNGLVQHITEELIPTLMEKSNYDTMQNDMSEIYEAYPDVKDIASPKIEKSLKGNGKGRGLGVLGLVFFLIGLLWGLLIGVLIGRATKK